MKLDRYTQKAQEAILAAQRLATRRRTAPSSTPSTSSPPCSRTTEGVPAATLRRLGADLPPSAHRAGRACCARRARIAGRLADPRSAGAARCCQRAEDEARRLKDEYVSTEHLLLAASEAGGDAQRILDAAGASKERSCGALASVRGGQRVTVQNPEIDLPGAREVRPRPDRATPARASSTRSSAATRRSAASSRCSAAGPRTTPC